MAVLDVGVGVDVDVGGYGLLVVDYCYCCFGDQRKVHLTYFLAKEECFPVPKPSPAPNQPTAIGPIGYSSIP